MSTIFQVEKMSCKNCARHVTEAIQAAQAGAQVNVDLASGKVEVTPSVADAAAVAKAISEAGYPARPVA
jgi:copper chaperone CopZ